MSGIIDDPRQILLVTDWRAQADVFHVGTDDVVAITAYAETGQCAAVPAVLIEFEDGSAARLILGPGLAVRYGRPKAKGAAP